MCVCVCVCVRVCVCVCVILSSPAALHSVRTATRTGRPGQEESSRVASLPTLHPPTPPIQPVTAWGEGGRAPSVQETHLSTDSLHSPFLPHKYLANSDVHVVPPEDSSVLRFTPSLLHPHTITDHTPHLHTPPVLWKDCSFCTTRESCTGKWICLSGNQLDTHAHSFFVCHLLLSL